MIGTRDQNALLSQYRSTGCSMATARQNGCREGGDASSKQIAERDLPEIQKIQDTIVQAATDNNVPPAVLAALASRESHVGALLVNGWGDAHHAFGICQVNARSHRVVGLSNPYGYEHLNQVAGIISDFWKQIIHRHDDWEPARQLQGAIAAYNTGVGNIQTLDGMDNGTTGNDYSNDCWSRAQFFSE